jgi:hypothetical protein
MVKVVTKAEAEAAAAVEEAPVEAVAPTEEPVSEDANLENWDDSTVDELLADDEDSMPAPEPEPEPETAEAAEEETPAEEPEPEEPEPEPPAEAAEAEEEVVVPETPEVPEEPENTRTPEEVAEAAKKARESARENLVEQFKMTEEQEEAFAQNPGEFLSNLAADLYLDLYDSMMVGIQTQMPQMVQGIIHTQTTKTKAEQAFFKAWPQLAKPEYKATIDRISDTYSANNRGASQEDAIREIGAQSWVALKLPLDELLALTQTSAPAEPEPKVEIQHVPAGTGAARGNAPKPPQLNDYEQLAEEFIFEDQ